MNSIGFAKAVVVLVTMLGAPSALGQTPAPNPPSNAPAEPRPPVVAQGETPRDATDARHCLDLATNTEVMACAEKYRSRKARR